MLRDISNPDKHREPIGVSPSKIIRIGNSPISDTPFTSMSTDMNIEVTVQATLDDGTPVIEALQIPHSEVTAVLDSFESDFT